jgi:hypothetical protein
MSQLRPFDLALAPDKRRGSFVVGGGEVLDRLLKLLGTAKARADNAFRVKMPNQISTWLSQLAEVGVKWNVTLG